MQLRVFVYCCLCVNKCAVSFTIWYEVSFGQCFSMYVKVVLAFIVMVYFKEAILACVWTINSWMDHVKSRKLMNKHVESIQSNNTLNIMAKIKPAASVRPVKWSLMGSDAIMIVFTYGLDGDTVTNFCRISLSRVLFIKYFC